MKPFDRIVLSTVAALGANAYGVPIRREVAQRTEGDVAIRSIYAALERLEAKGLVATRQGDATAERGWLPKLYWSLTGSGWRALYAKDADDHRRDWQQYVINSIC